MTRPTTTARPLDAITEEAIAWFVRMQSDQRTLADEDRFAQWLQQSPGHGQAYARIEKVWRGAGSEITPSALEREGDAIRAEEKPSRRRWWAYASMAAALAIVAIGTVFILNEQFSRIRSGTFATGAGAQQVLKLADGSTITLNTRSEVSIDLSEHQRSIRLARGEARFQVAKDVSRPFIVDAGAARVRAVGTAFDVRVSDERVAVTLVEGRVEVTPTLAAIKASQPALLSAGQQLSLELESGERHVADVNLDRASAWMQQQIIFDSVPLTAAIEEANRYLVVPIVIDDPTIADIRISGVVRAGSVESLVGSLESSFPIRAIERTDGLWMLMRRDSAQQP